MNWYFKVLSNYALFEGRAHRREYWMFFLINVIIGFVLGSIEMTTGLTVGPGYGVISGLYGLVVLVPGVGVTVRRLHDTGRSGWWCFLILGPVVGTIALLIFLAQEGQAGANRFGEKPAAA